ncbi:MAG: tRNA preQ1(34) S-adenosylmethionine ribosyltransferase-isomerase QueA [Candidatus Latescibacterota bacterium]|nr:tRNA preQ1(34) S-adenosylmethionine ribosyltransferase-isomerase QueA [Candidatus Latescibacterota bacterium]
MKLQELDFDLPPDQIAQYPAERRDASRLLAVERNGQGRCHHTFADIVELLNPEDTLVLNRSRVLPVRLHGIKARTGGRIELLVMRRDEEGVWLAMGRPIRNLEPGDEVELFAQGLRLELVERTADDHLRLRELTPLAVASKCDDPTGLVAIQDLMEAEGHIPLPPYIRREPVAEDHERYQTVFACEPGSIAAPTAGLHFTPEILEALRRKGLALLKILLHVGPGTFAPIREDDPTHHRLEAEYFQLEEDQAEEIRQRCRAGGRTIAVGTTSVRLLETAAGSGELLAGRDWTDLLITPGHEFRAVDAVLSNFHLPRSSLLMLIAAFAGYETTMQSYAEAVREGYRFYSYGDAMLVS